MTYKPEDQQAQECLVGFWERILWSCIGYESCEIASWDWNMMTAKVERCSCPSTCVQNIYIQNWFSGRASWRTAAGIKYLVKGIWLNIAGHMLGSRTTIRLPNQCWTKRRAWNLSGGILNAFVVEWTGRRRDNNNSWTFGPCQQSCFKRVFRIHGLGSMQYVLQPSASSNHSTSCDVTIVSTFVTRESTKCIEHEPSDARSDQHAPECLASGSGDQKHRCDLATAGKRPSAYECTGTMCSHVSQHSSTHSCRRRLSCVCLKIFQDSALIWWAS